MIKEKRQNEVNQSEIDAYFNKFGLDECFEKFFANEKVKEVIQIAYMKLQEEASIRLQKIPKCVDVSYFEDIIKIYFKYSFVNLFIKNLEEKLDDDDVISRKCRNILNEDLNVEQLEIIEYLAQSSIDGVLEISRAFESGEIQINPDKLS